MRDNSSHAVAVRTYHCTGDCATILLLGPGAVCFRKNTSDILDQYWNFDARAHLYLVCFRPYGSLQDCFDYETEGQDNESRNSNTYAAGKF